MLQEDVIDTMIPRQGKEMVQPPFEQVAVTVPNFRTTRVGGRQKVERLGDSTFLGYQLTRGQCGS